MKNSDKKSNEKKADKKEQPKQGVSKTSDAKKAAPDSKEEPKKEKEKPKEKVKEAVAEDHKETGAKLIEQLKNCQLGEEVAVFIKLKKLSDYKNYLTQANDILKQKHNK